MFSCFLCGSRETSSERLRSVEESYHIGSQPVQGNSQDEKVRYKSLDPDKLLNPSLVLRSINTRNMSSRPGMRGGHSLNVIPESSILANQDPDFSLVDATGVDEAAPRKAAYEYEERAAGMQMGAKKRPSFDEMVARKSIEFRLEFSNKN